MNFIIFDSDSNSDHISCCICHISNHPSNSEYYDESRLDKVIPNSSTYRDLRYESGVMGGGVMGGGVTGRGCNGNENIRTISTEQVMLNVRKLLDVVELSKDL